MMNHFKYKNAIGITAMHAHLDDFRYKKHAHQEYAMGVTLRGLQSYHLGGIHHLSHTSGVMLFNPEETHDGQSYDAQGLEYIMLYIKPAMLREALGLTTNVKFTTPIIYNPRISERIIKLWQAIFYDNSEAECHERFVDLIDQFPRQAISSSSRADNAKTKLAIEMIKQHYNNKLNLEQLSQALEMSKYQFIRFFKKQTGLTPHQYYINYKVERAKQIIETYKDVYWAIAECNFVDLAHLNKCFKYRYGVTAYQFMSGLR